ncbi:uncharacterized protein LOC119572459 [Penaeus monodon]|uniref:uncharacterized protein LOC119572459 n=1 Tax=Penaeus monodon TaxID=6687 RepID=UPI0018A7416C|nr:uncharacterized protein LOC119572459 [Penaeus monodon]
MKATYEEDAAVKHWNYQFRCFRRSEDMAPVPGRPSLPLMRRQHPSSGDCHFGREPYYCSSNSVIVGSVIKIIHDHLHMQKLSVRWAQRLLTPFQKQERLHCSEALLASTKKTRRTFLTD